MQNAHLDKIVATYAPMGAQRARKRNQRRLIGGSVLLSACAAVALFTNLDIRIGGQATNTTTGIDSGAFGSDEIAQLRLEQAAVAEKFAALARQVEAVQQQKAELEAQQTRFEQESMRFAALLEGAEGKLDNLQDDRAQGLKLEEEINAMAAQRQALGERWQQFEAQGELLALQIVAVNAQRKELEKQRGLIERQRRELSKLLEQAEQLYQRNVSAAGLAPSDETSSLSIVDGDSLDGPLVDSVDTLVVQNAELDSMRGGFSVGEGLDISFGFQQAGFVNGKEQFNNSFSVGSFASGFSDVDMSNMNSVVLQNGSGNFVGANVFDALSDTFGNVIQNTLDDQVISTTTIYDISLHNVPGALQGLAGEQALYDSLGSF